jgi:hypothetical protein
MVQIPEISKNTLVPYSTYNFPIRTESDISFTTILINSKLYHTKSYIPSYKYTQLPSSSPHLLSYPALLTTLQVLVHLQYTFWVSISTMSTQTLLETIFTHPPPFLTTIMNICRYTCWFVCLLVHVA